MLTISIVICNMTHHGPGGSTGQLIFFSAPPRPLQAALRSRRLRHPSHRALFRRPAPRGTAPAARLPALPGHVRPWCSGAPARFGLSRPACHGRIPPAVSGWRDWPDRSLRCSSGARSALAAHLGALRPSVSLAAPTSGPAGGLPAAALPAPWVPSRPPSPPPLSSRPPP